jgi:hypothetical protein
MNQILSPLTFGPDDSIRKELQQPRQLKAAVTLSLFSLPPTLKSQIPQNVLDASRPVEHTYACTKQSYQVSK